MVSALAVAVRSQRETEECCAGMFLGMLYVMISLITYFIHHVTEYCTVIGQQSTEW